jgi:hypothetical protein
LDAILPTCEYSIHLVEIVIPLLPPPAAFAGAGDAGLGAGFGAGAGFDLPLLGFGAAIFIKFCKSNTYVCNGFYWNTDDADLQGCFIFIGIHCDTNRCTDFTDFTDAVRIFFNPNALFQAKNKKNPYRVREIC